MTYPISESRGRTGKGPLQLSTVIPLGADRREMQIITSKHASFGILICMVTVYQLSVDGGSRTYVIGMGDKQGDFVCRHGTSRERATPKALYAMHQAALRDAELLLNAARQHYAGLALQAAA